ncbi:MAG: hypothetical protein K1W21_11125 [Oscillospiraceae bacterium]
MTYLNVRVTRIWDPDWYPGFAECALVDASGAEHRFQDKIPVFSARTLTLDDLPCEGAVRCVRAGGHPDGTITVDTAFPDDIESETGEHLFRVFPHQLTDGEAFL